MSQANLRARKADPGRLPMVGAQGASMGKDQGGKGTDGGMWKGGGTFLKPGVVWDPALQVYLEVPPL